MFLLQIPSPSPSVDADEDRASPRLGFFDMGRDQPADARPVAFIDRESRQCAWPIEPVETPGSARMLCCGAPAGKASPYCAAHVAMARCDAPAQPVKPPYEATIIRRVAA